MRFLIKKKAFRNSGLIRKILMPTFVRVNITFSQIKISLTFFTIYDQSHSFFLQCMIQVFDPKIPKMYMIPKI